MRDASRTTRGGTWRSSVAHKAWTRGAEAQRPGAGWGSSGTVQFLERLRSDGAVVVDAGCPVDAGWPRSGCLRGAPIAQPPAGAKVAGVVDHRFCARWPPFLVVLLDPRVLAVDVQRRDHPVGYDVGSVPRGVRRVTRRSKINCTCSERPASRFSRMTSSKRRPGLGRTVETCVRANSACRIERS